MPFTIREVIDYPKFSPVPRMEIQRSRKLPVGFECRLKGRAAHVNNSQPPGGIGKYFDVIDQAVIVQRGVQYTHVGPFTGLSGQEATQKQEDEQQWSE
jgi:hypothetical protein